MNDRKKKILIIDINSFIFDAIRNIFIEYDVTYFKDESAAFEELKINHKNYVAILLDINLFYDITPEKKEIKQEKLDFCRRIRQIDDTLPIIFMTSIPKWQEYENIFNKIKKLGYNLVHKVEDIIPDKNGKIQFKEIIVSEIWNLKRV